MKPITITLTSCDRFDLLQQTLDSFFNLNDYPYVAFHIHNDSTKAVPLCLKQRYQDRNITWHEGTKRGLSGAWDYLVNLVETEYFFNLEDDWLFNGNPYFIAESLHILETSIVDQVWIRHESDHNHPIIEGRKYNLLDRWGDWCGFSFNPSVRRKADWVRMFPNGITGKDEIELSREVKPHYMAAALKNTSIRHIGGGRHTSEFIV